MVCGKPVLDPIDEHAITNPTMLVEVLSPTTADYDRGGKFAHYRTLESLREYVVISLEPRVVEHHRRIEPGKWLLTEIAGSPIELESVGATLAWDELWTDLDRLA